MMNNVIESLSSNPCYLAIISAMIIALLIIKSNNRHQQKMEEIRVSQLMKVSKGKKHE